ncbi:MAG: hypothetical protein JXB23_02380 [Candidatus Aminicenantes bacterium]|nr:hypothetical protein [Candidatus Aminicenantes bacterium]
MKKIKTVCAVIFLGFLCATPGQGVEFSLKLSAGFGFMSPDGVNGALKDWERWQILNAEATKNWNYLGGEVSEISLAYNLEVEFLVFLSSRFAAGIASGYLFGDVSESDTTLTVEKVLGTFEGAKPTKMSAIPLFLTVYYFQPITTSFRMYLRGGGGLLWGTYVEREATKRADLERYGYPLSLEATARDTAYLLALGLLYETEPGIQFFIEGSWRGAKLSGFTGKDQSGSAGSLFFFEEYDSSLDFWQGKYKILSEKPEGENFRAVKEGEIDFSGFAVKLGIMIRF